MAGPKLDDGSTPRAARLRSIDAIDTLEDLPGVTGRHSTTRRNGSFCLLSRTNPPVGVPPEEAEPARPAAQAAQKTAVSHSHTPPVPARAAGTPTHAVPHTPFRTRWILKHASAHADVQPSRSHTRDVGVPPEEAEPARSAAQAAQKTPITHPPSIVPPAPIVVDGKLALQPLDFRLVVCRQPGMEARVRPLIPSRGKSVFHRVVEHVVESGPQMPIRLHCGLGAPAPYLSPMASFFPIPQGSRPPMQATQPMDHA